MEPKSTMKYRCPRCGDTTLYVPGKKCEFCSYEENISEPPIEPPVPEPPKKKNNVLLMLMCLAIACMGVFWFLRSGAVKNTEQADSQMETQKSSFEMNEAESEEMSEEEVAKTQTTEEVTESGIETELESETETKTEELVDTETQIHEYRLFVENCSWEEARERCTDMGGYLVRINSLEEFEYLKNLIVEQGYEKKQFYIGMRRDDGAQGYYLVDAENQLIGERMDNGYTSWCQELWLDGEPTYRDSNLGLDETVVEMFRYSGTGEWLLNDVPEDLVGAYSGNKDRVGYICEFE